MRLEIAGTRNSLPIALSIAGSDSGAGAGIQADLLSFAANGAWGTTVLTGLTAQNPEGVAAIHPVPVEFIKEQIRSVLDYFPVGAAKTGMLGSEAVIHLVADELKAKRIPLVVDPVMVASSGARLLEAAAERALAEALFPLATLVTPNLDEARILGGEDLDSEEGLLAGALRFADRFGVAFLLKGGHLASDDLVDVLAEPGSSPRFFRSKRIGNVNTHGSGCTLSAAIAAHLAAGCELVVAVERGHGYLQRGFRAPARVDGRRFIGHFPR